MTVMLLPDAGVNRGEWCLFYRAMAETLQYRFGNPAATLANCPGYGYLQGAVAAANTQRQLALQQTGCTCYDDDREAKCSFC